MNTLIGVLKSSKSWSISSQKSEFFNSETNKNKNFQLISQSETQNINQLNFKNTRNVNTTNFAGICSNRVAEIERAWNDSKNLSNSTLNANKVNFKLFKQNTASTIKSISYRHFSSVDRQISLNKVEYRYLRRPTTSNSDLSSRNNSFFTNSINRTNLYKINENLINNFNKSSHLVHLPVHNNQINRNCSFPKNNSAYLSNSKRLQPKVCFQNLNLNQLSNKKIGSISPKSHSKNINKNLGSSENWKLPLKISLSQENTTGAFNNQILKSFFIKPSRMSSGVLNPNNVVSGYHRSSISDKQIIKNVNLESKELEVDLKEIKVRSLLGFGSTSLVYLAFWRGTEVAIKIFETRNNESIENSYLKSNLKISEPLELSQKGMQRYLEFKCEVNMLRLVRHPNIVQYMGSNIKSNPPFLISEFCSGGTLFNLLHGTSTKCTEDKDFTFSGPSINLSLYQRLKILLDIARGINFLHSSNPVIIHRDIKSLNIFLLTPIKTEFDIPLAKIGDFGLCRQMNLDKSRCNITENLVGTYQWMAPEVIENQVYNEYIDIYSFGMIMYEVLSNKTPFFEMGINVNPEVLVSEITRGIRPTLSYISCEIPQKFVEIMVRCWDQIPSNRGNMLLIVEELETYLNEFKIK